MVKKSISSFEAKTKLSSLLREAEQGQEFIITNRGRPVAKLVPLEQSSKTEWELFQTFAKKIRVSQNQKISTKDLISDGRKY